jgi:hypothetical protein
VPINARPANAMDMDLVKRAAAAVARRFDVMAFSLFLAAVDPQSPRSQSLG